MAVVFGFAMWNYIQAGGIRPSALDLEAIDAKRKHSEFLVDVGTMPGISFDGIVIRLGSLEELFKAAEALMKPVLHYSKLGQHTYYVLDESTLYRYLNQEESSNPPVHPNDNLLTNSFEAPPC